MIYLSILVKYYGQKVLSSKLPDGDFHNLPVYGGCHKYVPIASFSNGKQYNV